VLVRFVVATFVITGGVLTTDVVRKVELVELADIAPEFAETTSKSYVVPSVRPVSVTEWLVTIVESSVEFDPYAVVVPKFTRVVDGWSVVHVIVAEVLVMLPTDTFEITGGPAGAVPVVVKLIIAELPVAPFAPVDIAWK
jgi:cation transporter-like permease